MTDTMMHFLACFFITIVSYIVILGYKIKKMKHPISETNKNYWLDRYAEESFILAAVIGMLAGIGKEIWDIFFSDPQIHDLIADAIGVVVALLILNRTEGNLIGGKTDE